MKVYIQIKFELIGVKLSAQHLWDRQAACGGKKENQAGDSRRPQLLGLLPLSWKKAREERWRVGRFLCPSIGPAVAGRSQGVRGSRRMRVSMPPETHCPWSCFVMPGNRREKPWRDCSGGPSREPRGAIGPWRWEGWQIRPSGPGFPLLARGAQSDKCARREEKSLCYSQALQTCITFLGACLHQPAWAGEVADSTQKGL